MANRDSRLPDDVPPDAPATAADPEGEPASQGVLWLPILLGILVTVTIVAALFGITVLEIHLHG
ncbi:MAG TPA: hypothetical protein VHV31_11875 [Nitrolancea sp.]|nr:hypothetical protein [Nitrolancea sp.]